MSLFTKLGNEIASPVDAAGNPRAVENVDMQRWMTEVERATLAFQAGGGIIFPDLATANASLAYAQNQMAWVIGDPVPANNGVYRKIGASGSGSWARLGDLPISMIRLDNAGAGTADAIIAEPMLPLPTTPGAALLTVNILADNTGNVTLNGKPLRTNSGNEIAPGGLTAGSIHAFLDLGSEYRLLSDQASAAVLAGAEAAQVAAESAAGANLSNADSVVAAEITNVPGSVNYIRTAGYAAAGDGGGALYKRVLTEPVHVGKFQSADGAWWESTSRRVLIFASGDSNMVYGTHASPLSFDWTPPPNLFVWDGSTYVAARDDTIGVATSFAAEYARSNPHNDVYLVTIGQGGASIDRWIGGLHGYFYDAGATDPTSIDNGEVRFDSANLQTATSFYVYMIDKDGYQRFASFQASMGGASKVRFEKDGDPETYIEYTLGEGGLIGGYRTYEISYLSKSGTIVDDDPIRIRTDRDVWAMITSQMPSALNKAGLSKADIHLGWFTNDAASPDLWVSDFETYWERLLSSGYVDDATETLLFGVNSEANSGNSALGAFHQRVQMAVQGSPWRRAYFPTGFLPSYFWSDSLHMTAEGYELAGRLGYQAISGGSGFKPPAGGYVFTESGQIAIPGQVGRLSDQSGVYTPTLTDVANIAAKTAHPCRWSRIGDIVRVSGCLEVTPSATSTATRLRISLPLFSNFSSGTEDAAGTAAGLVGQAAAIFAVALGPYVEFRWQSNNTNNNVFYFTFEYSVK